MPNVDFTVTGQGDIPAEYDQIGEAIGRTVEKQGQLANAWGTAADEASTSSQESALTQVAVQDQLEMTSESLREQGRTMNDLASTYTLKSDEAADELGKIGEAAEDAAGEVEDEFQEAGDEVGSVMDQLADKMVNTLGVENVQNILNIAGAFGEVYEAITLAYGEIEKFAEKQQELVDQRVQQQQGVTGSRQSLLLELAKQGVTDFNSVLSGTEQLATSSGRTEIEINQLLQGLVSDGQTPEDALALLGRAAGAAADSGTLKTAVGLIGKGEVDASVLDVINQVAPDASADLGAALDRALERSATTTPEDRLTSEEIEQQQELLERTGASRFYDGVQTTLRQMINGGVTRENSIDRLETGISDLTTPRVPIGFLQRAAFTVNPNLFIPSEDDLAQAEVLQELLDEQRRQNETLEEIRDQDGGLTGVNQ